MPTNPNPSNKNNTDHNSQYAMPIDQLISEVHNGLSSPFNPQIIDPDIWDSMLSDKVTAQRWCLDIGRQSILNGNSSGQFYSTPGSGYPSNYDTTDYPDVTSSVNVAALNGKFGSQFWPKLANIASNAGTNPSYLLIIMAFESGLKTDSNGGSNYGILQQGVGDPGWPRNSRGGPISPDEFLSEDAVTQLDAVAGYFAGNHPADGTFPNVYMAVHYPKANTNKYPLSIELYGKDNGGLQATLGPRAEKSSDVFSSNGFTDAPGGIVTKGFAATKCYEYGVNTLTRMGLLNKGN